MSYFLPPWTAAHQASLSITNSRSMLKLMSIEAVMPSNHLILCHPLLLLPSVFPHIRASSKESVLCIRWPKYWCFSFCISPSNEHPGLISLRIDWLDIPAVQGPLKSLESPFTARKSNQSSLKEVNPEYSLEGLMQKLKLQYFGHPAYLTYMQSTS